MPKTLLDLPIYRAVVSDNLKDDTELQAIALVPSPAIQANFLAFADQAEVRFAVNEDRRILTGPIMIAGQPIYRDFGGKIGKCYIVYEAEAIYSMVQRFFVKGYQANVNFLHKGDVVEGITMFESFISDPERGVQPLGGHEKTPSGSWFGSFYVENEEAWNRVKEGEFKGFSIQGLFDLIPVAPDEEAEVIEVVNSILEILKDGE
jgi:hypothetical protein